MLFQCEFEVCSTSSCRAVKVHEIFLDPDLTGADLRLVTAHDGVCRESDSENWIICSTAGLAYLCKVLCSVYLAD